MPTEFILPELGENIQSGDVLRVLVQPGDRIERDQAIIELETDKATIEVPSSVAGRVTTVNVKPGDKIEVGQSILTLNGASAPDSGSAPDVSSSPAPPTESDERQSASVSPGSSQPTSEAPAFSDRKVIDFNVGTRQTVPTPAAAPARPLAPAAPSVRRMARELGVDINQVQGSGQGGRISVDDVKAHAKRIVAGVTTAASGAPMARGVLVPDFSRWGEVDRQPMRAVRRKAAEHLAAAWATVPHVSQHEVADVSALEELRKRYAKHVEAVTGSLTVTAIAVKVVASALRRFPQFNSSIDLAADEIVLKKYINIGIAVDTDRGLLVPVIRAADAKNIVQLSVELSELSTKARSHKLAPEDMQGGSFSISNLGGIGGTFFTPIVNTPEVAILGISRARMEPVYDAASGQFVPRLMLPLSLSYDHRVIDGADGIRFLRWVAEALERPFLLALEG